jgi:hypothetical protein
MKRIAVTVCVILVVMSLSLASCASLRSKESVPI